MAGLGKPAMTQSWQGARLAAHLSLTAELNGFHVAPLPRTLVCSTGSGPSLHMKSLFVLQLSPLRRPRGPGKQG